MAERIISLRPHHVDHFVGYYHKFSHMFDNPWILEKDYGKEFPVKLRKLFDYIASGGNNEDYILIRNDLDSICCICPWMVKRETCRDPDDLSLLGSGYIMEQMYLEEGGFYTLGEFLERVKRVYPNRIPEY